ncbi:MULTISPECIES: hypothetical protein [Aeromonas]|uniref:hypothetical protein n=1 Tax=Aeromonas TaxID=642 RepID=UPI0022E65FA0|nr:hypothetical protein [Aeromonas sp. S41-2]
MSNTIVNSLNRVAGIIANERSRQDALNEIDDAIKQLTDLRAKIAGESHGVSNSFGGGFGGGSYHSEPMPE